MRTLSLLLALSVPAFGATPRVAVLPFSGPKGDFVREQFLATICDQLVCVSQGKVTTSGKKGPDWAKVKDNALDGVLLGKISKVDGKVKLKLKLLTAPGAKPAVASVVLDKHGELGHKQDRKLMVLLEKKLKSTKPADPETPPPASSDDETELAKKDAPAKEAPAKPAPQVARAEAPAPTARTDASKSEPTDPSADSEDEDAELTTVVPSGTTQVAEEKHYKPLPPELLGMTPRL